MKQTENYGLNQWELTDRIRMEDFNRDNAKIDAALAEEKAAREILTATVAKCGDCTIECKTYTGNGKTGSSNAIQFTFDKTPQIIFITGYSTTAIALRGAYTAFSSNSAGLRINWSGNTVSWYNDNNYVAHMNDNGSIYTVMALTM